MPFETITPQPEPAKDDSHLTRSEAGDSNHSHPCTDKQLDLIWRELGNLRNDIRWVIGLSVCTLGWIVTHVR